MPQTASQAAQDLVARAAKYDARLADDIRAFAQQREFGLVFEHNRPERMRLYGKPVMPGDVVQVLPERGKVETDENRELWRVVSVDGDIAAGEATAQLVAYAAFNETDAATESTVAAYHDVVAVAEYDEPVYAGLVETGRLERGGDKPYQVVINGENFHALEMLTFCYAGKIDCIYIDPPYNTGNKDWKYNNDYVDSKDVYRHSKWLAFMERRLRLAKQLLKPTDSVLIVTIDEKEYLRLGMLLEQVFPGENVQIISTLINPKGRGKGNEFSRVGEFIYVIQFGDAELYRRSEAVEPGEEPEVDWQTFRRRDLASVRRTRPGQFFPIYVNDSTGQIEAIGDPIPHEMNRENAPQRPGCTAVFPIRADGTEMNWSTGKPTAEDRWKHGYLRAGDARPNEPQKYIIQYLKAGSIEDIESGKATVLGHHEDGSVIAKYMDTVSKVPKTIWTYPSHNAEPHGTKLIKRFIGPGRFDFPKSLYAVHDILWHFLAEKKDATVLDFFAGSGTTAHAVALLNKKDSGRRVSVSVTNNEHAEKEEKALIKRGLRPGDPEWERTGVCRFVTVPRIVGAITGRDVNGKPVKGDYGLRRKKTTVHPELKAVDKETKEDVKGKYTVTSTKTVYDENGTGRFPMADGFEENAAFFDLVYLDPDAVELGEAFTDIAPLLWMRGGSQGRMITEERDSFAIADTYGVLFDISDVNEFACAIEAGEGVKVAYVVTDDDHAFSDARSRLPRGVDVVRLYQSYLRSFEIAAEDAVR